MHHAYYVEGPLSRFESLQAELHPFSASAYERFGIDEARQLIALSSLKNFEEAVFLVGASQMTTEAQQAMLKLLEEPQEGTTFVFLVPHGTLLPTMKSRMQSWVSQEPIQKKVLGSPRPANLENPILQARPDYFSEQALAFLAASPKARSEIVAELLDEDEGVRERVRDFLNALEAELAVDIKKNAAALQEIAMVRDYLRDRSPSLKMLFEHLALAL